MISIRITWQERLALSEPELRAYNAMLTTQEHLESTVASGVTLERIGLSLYTLAAASMATVATTPTAHQLVDQWTALQRVWEARTAARIARETCTAMARQVKPQRVYIAL